MRMRCSLFPDASNKHSSTDSELSENSEKLQPLPSQFAPCGNGDPAIWCDRSYLAEIAGTPFVFYELYSACSCP